MQQNPLTVLLVEDDETLANLLRSKLETHGYLVTVAVDGDAGIASIRASKPDILLLDVSLPFRNGLQILESLRAEGILPSLPVIIVSNSGQPVDIERAKRLGVRDWLVKAEIEPDDILLKVDRVAKEIMDTGKSAVGNGIQQSEVHTPAHGSSAPTVLLIEDDLMIADMLRQKLATKQYVVLIATSEPEIDAVLEEHAVRIILLDILLPGLNGLSILKKVKEDPRYKDIQVLIISNLGQREDIERGMAGGAAGYFVKANTYPDEIVTKVDALLKTTSN
ncbi:MAG: response regulator [bacterium]|nr:response regulator [bacterium]MDZ4285019.1 response regulator [Patescibacteria group bacterium]